ncbi:CI-B8 domain-containing protein [Lasiosphaeris hirsuta]|uniref:CI-B8 domain-containing protein n=1 Tax=Lasiosphaeris hirsuta TaxID=260670 RepID=A0AA39ZWT2_9PEZI|nr:CI-B8 domain-containing protein [Lasiosphaeris hirsuta]
MVGVIRRMHHLKDKILALRNGPGAALLPENVSRIHVEFCHRMNGGHMGPRKFWQENLPKIKFWNPAVPIIVNRLEILDGPAKMTIYFRDDKTSAPSTQSNIQLNSSSTGTSPAPAPADGERTVVVDMKARHSTDILSEFLAITSAVPVKATPQEEMEMRELEDLKRKGEIDRTETRNALEAERREKARLALAMNEAASIKAAAT